MQRNYLISLVSAANASISGDNPRSDQPAHRFCQKNRPISAISQNLKTSKSEIASEKKQKCELAFVTGINPHFVETSTDFRLSNSFQESRQELEALDKFR